MSEADTALETFAMPGKAKPIPSGTMYGEVEVLSIAPPYQRRDGRMGSQSNVKCHACGRIFVYRNVALKKGDLKSCGCKQVENAAKGVTRHGHARNGRRSPELTSWRMMIRRCTDPKCRDWLDYGGRGIAVCNRWLGSFENFLADMGVKPSPQHSIERKDVNADYGPENCHWAPLVEQANNKRNTFWVEYCGKRMSLSQLSAETGEPLSALRRRIISGMSADQAVASSSGRRRLPGRRRVS